MNPRRDALRRSKRQKRLRLGALLVLLAACVASGHPVLALVTALLGYVLNELLWADHIFYPVSVDQQHYFAQSMPVRARLSGGELALLQTLPEGVDTLLLPVSVCSGWWGRWRDPWIELVSGGEVLSRQYLERGARGRRYLNLGAGIPALRSGALGLVTRGCRLVEGELELLAFANPPHRGRRTLILAPHADDAELAAFGLYQGRDDVYVVTVSAGEIEAEPFLDLAGGDIAQAARLKGRLRAWDSIAVPQWAGVPAEHCVQLGYFCMTLPAMRQQPGQVVPSRAGESLAVGEFRAFNRLALPSDGAPENRWDMLVADLAYLLNEWRPEQVVLPHPLLDSHPDHVACAQAFSDACALARQTPELLLYANHHALTEMYPFGPEHADLALPPWFDDVVLGGRLLALPLSPAQQRDKACALAMMHDLNRPERFKRRLRRGLQRYMLGRSRMPYGADDYFRRAVRQHELFWSADCARLADWCAAEQHRNPT